MIVVPAGVKVHLALGHTDMRKACHADPGTSEKGSLLGSSVRVPRQERIASEDPVLGWDGVVPVYQAHRSWKFLVAAHGGAWGHGDVDTRAARYADRGYRLASAGTLLAPAFGWIKIRRKPHRIE
jgi:acetyl esterase/lipase